MDWVGVFVRSLTERRCWIRAAITHRDYNLISLALSSVFKGDTIISILKLNHIYWIVILKGPLSLLSLQFSTSGLSIFPEANRLFSLWTANTKQGHSPLLRGFLHQTLVLTVPFWFPLFQAYLKNLSLPGSFCRFFVRFVHSFLHLYVSVVGLLKHSWTSFACDFSRTIFHWRCMRTSEEWL